MNQGVLVYISEGNVRLLNIHDQIALEQVLYLSKVVKRQFQGLDAEILDSVLDLIGVKFSLLSYSDDILVCLCQIREALDEVSAWLVINDLSASRDRQKVELPPIPLQSINKLFVRHDRSHLVYGIHSLDEDGSREWCFTTISLTSHSQPSSKLRPKKFTGFKIDATVSFTLYRDYFYAVSSERVLQGVDYTSCYHCVRFPLERPTEEAMEIHKNVWRRQHREGPINDLWSDLTLRVDEKTGDLLIVEARREWIAGGSSSQRTYYIKLLSQEFSSFILPTPDTPSPTSTNSSSSSSPNIQPLSESLPLINYTDYLSQKIYQDHFDRRRLPKHVHKGDGTDTPKSFSIQDTKFRAYNPGANAWLDLVNDKQVDPRTYIPQQRLRLRVGSRKLKPPKRDIHGLLAKGPTTEEPCDDGMEEEWDDSAPPKLWPPAPDEADNHDHDLMPSELAWINAIMNPGPKNSSLKMSPADVQAVGDESCVAYSVPACIGGGRVRKALVVVGFNDGLKSTSMKRKHEHNEMGGQEWPWGWERAKWIGTGKYWRRSK